VKHKRTTKPPTSRSTTARPRGQLQPPHKLTQDQNNTRKPPAQKLGPLSSVTGEPTAPMRDRPHDCPYRNDRRSPTKPRLQTASLAQKQPLAQIRRRGHTVAQGATNLKSRAASAWSIQGGAAATVTRRRGRRWCSRGRAAWRMRGQDAATKQ
jgi:hypothetical protein